MTTNMRLAFAILVMGVFGCSGDSMLGPGDQQEGFVTNGDIKIHYKLDLPDGDGPFPAVVYGPGSGNISADFRTHVDTQKSCSSWVLQLCVTINAAPVNQMVRWLG